MPRVPKFSNDEADIGQLAQLLGEGDVLSPTNYCVIDSAEAARYRRVVRQSLQKRRN